MGVVLQSAARTSTACGETQEGGLLMITASMAWEKCWRCVEREKEGLHKVAIETARDEAGGGARLFCGDRAMAG